MYPRLHGGNGDCWHTAIDVDSSGNIAAGSSSNANILVSPIGLPNPYTVYYSPTGVINWAKQYPDVFNYVASVKFNPMGTILLVAIISLLFFIY